MSSSITVYSIEGDELEQIEVKSGLFDLDVRIDLIKRAVDWQRAKARSGLHKTKTISEVSGTGKKPFAQKGTGRARQGSLRSNHMRGGGVVHGPVVRDHSIKLPKKVRKLALKHALSLKYLDHGIKVVDSLVANEVSTKLMNKKLGWINKASPSLNPNSKILFIDNIFDDNFKLSCRNLIFSNLLCDEGINVYDLLKNNTLVITKESLKRVENKLLS